MSTWRGRRKVKHVLGLCAVGLTVYWCVSQFAFASMVEKLRERGARAKPPLEMPEVQASMSSALPPGADPPELCAKVHKLLEEQPQLLEAVTGAQDLVYSPMTAADAPDLNDLQMEWFPKECYPDGIPWCEKVLSHDGVVALKASFPNDPDALIAGCVIALHSRGAIEQFAGKSTVNTLREELTLPRYIHWDDKERRTLGYIMSVGVISELRRKGIAAELLRRALADMERVAASQETEGLKAVALDLVTYNTAAIKCYEAMGFKKLKERVDAYRGLGRRTYSGYFYVREPEDATPPPR